MCIRDREKGNVIPGVAIATALMPPLCTAGFGLATGNLLYFLGAFYITEASNCSSFIESSFCAQAAKANADMMRTTSRYRFIKTLLPSSFYGYHRKTEPAVAGSKP